MQTDSRGRERRARRPATRVHLSGRRGYVLLVQVIARQIGSMRGARQSRAAAVLPLLAGNNWTTRLLPGVNGGNNRTTPLLHGVNGDNNRTTLLLHDVGGNISKRIFTVLSNQKPGETLELTLKVFPSIVSATCNSPLFNFSFINCRMYGSLDYVIKKVVYEGYLEMGSNKWRLGVIVNGFGRSFQNKYGTKYTPMDL